MQEWVKIPNAIFPIIFCTCETKIVKFDKNRAQYCENRMALKIKYNLHPSTIRYSITRYPTIPTKNRNSLLHYHRKTRKTLKCRKALTRLNFLKFYFVTARAKIIKMTVITTWNYEVNRNGCKRMVLRIFVTVIWPFEFTTFS